MQLSKSQLRLRRTGISSTDIAAICGLNLYRSAMAVYLDKIGKPIEHEETDAQWWGRALEPVIIKRYAQETGTKPKRNRKTLICPFDRLFLATPDAFVGDAPPRWGLEVKTAASARQVQRFGQAGDDLPEEYILQCQWCMLVTRLARWDVAVLLAGYHGFEYRQYSLAAHEGLQERLKEIARRFWKEYVMPQIAPPPDGTASAREALAALYPEDSGPILPGTGELADLATDLRMAEEEVQQYETEAESIRQQLKARIGDAAGIEGDFGKITWKANKRGVRSFRTFWKGE